MRGHYWGNTDMHSLLTTHQSTRSTRLATVASRYWHRPGVGAFGPGGNEDCKGISAVRRPPTQNRTPIPARHSFQPCSLERLQWQSLPICPHLFLCANAALCTVQARDKYAGPTDVEST